MASNMGRNVGDLMHKTIVTGLIGSTVYLTYSVSSQVYQLYNRRKESEAIVKGMLERGEITQEQIDESIRSKGRKPVVPAGQSNNGSE